ncbi:hypothetical protein ENSA5_29550 [Enhygromyxa salina]|uniref:Uncharacterized protein n=1 Tax=Enhygromyxa salina TaxID=215803 RepID=A0A2S9Y131_9BACT|nr:hypothetical protein ENSA5_29550 [Enhygromyxa salina]
MWFEPEELAAASRVELGEGPGAGVEPGGEGLLCRAPRSQQLLGAVSGPGVCLAALPGWPSAGAAGQGLGPALAQLVGELRPGDVVVVGGAARGVGRTSLLAQLSDGLALRQIPGQAQTPVVCVTEETPALWRARSLARWSGLDARVFVDPGQARREPELAARVAAFAQSAWAELDRRQRFVDARAFAGPDARAELLAALRRWRAELAPDAAHAVWPVVVVDPLEQLEGGPADALAELAELASDEGLIVLASCDEPRPEHTRRLDRHAGVRLRATPIASDGLELELCHRRLGPGGCVGLRWDRASGRIEPSA